MMTDVIDYDEIKNELDSDWNEAIVDKPTFVDGDLGGMIKEDQIQIFMNPSDTVIATTGVASSDFINTSFVMYISSNSKSNCDNMLGEVRRIINGKDKANAIWHIDDWFLRKSENLYWYNVSGSEILLDI